MAESDAQRAPELLRRFRKQPEPVVVLQRGATVLAQLAPQTQSTRVNELGEVTSITDRFFPSIRILHPLPCHRFDARTRGKSPVR